MQFIRRLSLCVIKFLLQAIEDRLVGRLGLAVGLGVSNGSEPSLVAQVAGTVNEPIGVKLYVVIKDNGTRDAEASDDVPPNKPPYFNGGYGGYGLGLYPLTEVIHCYKEIIGWPVALGKWSRMSIPQVTNGKGLIIGVLVVEGTRWMGANIWHLSYVCTSVMASSRKLGQ